MSYNLSQGDMRTTQELMNLSLSGEEDGNFDTLDIKLSQSQNKKRYCTDDAQSRHKGLDYRDERNFHRKKHSRHKSEQSFIEKEQSFNQMNYEVQYERSNKKRKDKSRSRPLDSRKYKQKKSYDFRSSKNNGHSKLSHRKRKYRDTKINDVSPGDTRIYAKQDIHLITEEKKQRKKQSHVEKERRHLAKISKLKQEQQSYSKAKCFKSEEPIVIVSYNSDSEINELYDEHEEEQIGDSIHSSRNKVRRSEHSGGKSETSDDESAGSERRSSSRSCSRSASGSSKRSASASPKSDRDQDLEGTMETGDRSEEEESEESKLFEDLPPYYPAVRGCRSVKEFQCLNRIEEGTYGVVYRARDKRTEDIVALKRLKMDKDEGFPITSLREINTLLKGQHPNIITVREVVVGNNMEKIIVMDYVEHDLKSLMETMRHKKQNFMPGEIKCLLRQLLLAVAHLHDNWILHRDLKTSNLLLSHKGILKVGDFGLAREYGSPLKAYTPIVVTLWYRAPELLLCTKKYSTPIDMWSVGCIFAELVLMKALFPGRSEVDQLNRIFKDLGTPSEENWPGFNQLPAVKKMKFNEYPVSNLRRKFNTLSEIGLGLLIKFLTYDPVQRVTAEEALQHGYFREPPLPIDPAMFPTWPAKSELGHKRALAASPKPPSGGEEYKKWGGEVDDDGYGFRIGMGVEKRREGPGFSLKF